MECEEKEWGDGKWRNGSSLKTRKFHLTLARKGYGKIDGGWVSRGITIAILSAKPETGLSPAVRRGQVGMVVDGCLSRCRTLSDWPLTQ